jgi:hypothetical protein
VLGNGRARTCSLVAVSENVSRAFGRAPPTRPGARVSEKARAPPEPLGRTPYRDRWLHHKRAFRTIFSSLGAGIFCVYALYSSRALAPHGLWLDIGRFND